ncbi:glycoside hydrolase family 13 protein [uncultured Draconibacterium sp.]|uniref:glycoside hydrolase family 13 protein n=1 Tax=uncultured Draconibacterium sp. TaxID=1573823 RepID=UPI0029C6433E|nr:glycoside hydrolase family 13 protein [uncultured Draconibacterium sp.]
MKRIIYTYFLVFVVFATKAQSGVDRIDPPCWWAGMNNPELQLMVHGDDIAKYDVEINFPGVILESVKKVENPNYLFLNLILGTNVNPGIIPLKFIKNGKTVFTKDYTLNERKQGSAKRTSFSSEDAVYLIMPDRFANGDYSNDILGPMSDKEDRNYAEGRHGGDIQGVIDHLDYVKKMGFTAIWLTPVRENNMDRASYHGYAITDFYKIDPRQGTNELYRELSNKCKEKGIKLILDVVTNHCGTNYYWKDDLPTQDWYNDYPNFKRGSFRPGTWSDPHAAEFDIHENESGWFDTVMPDLNHRNPLVAKYLIQNTIWWVEYADLDGLRSDTHVYNNREFIADWAKAVLYEYPKLNIVGEAWLQKPATLSYWQKDAVNKTGYNSNLPMVMDLPLHFEMRKAFNEPTGREHGLERLYDVISQDFLYANPNNLMLVIDNHDVSRIYNLMDKDVDNYKMLMTFLATTRGMPQLFAGSEILMEGAKEEGDGVMRRDFPGGWSDDKVNGFSGKGLSKDQIDAQKYVKTLFNWRKTSEAVCKGKLIHYVPQDGFYVYFRECEDELVMVILNSNSENKPLSLQRYADRIQQRENARNVITQEKFSDMKTLQVPAKTALVFEFY